MGRFLLEGAISTQLQTETATLGAGCFWGVEETFRVLPGVIETSVGYTGGNLVNPTYKQVCTDTTGHAEVVQVVFDPARITFEKILEVFWRSHNPMTLNRQGPDEGTQYRSVIFFHSEEQREKAEKSKAAAQPQFPRPIVTEISPAQKFYAAEDYHQKYVLKGGANCHV